MQGDAEDRTDRSLIARAASGEGAAFTELVRRHHGAILRYVRSLLRDDGRADDVVQDAFVQAFQYAGSFRGESSVRTWLLVIARNVASRARHRAERAASAEQSLEQLGLEAGWSSPEDPESFAMRLEERARVERAFRSLDEDAREILMLRDVEGLSGDEAAAVLGLSLAAMKSRLHRARLELTAALGKGA